jgi:hypothetical protein
VAVEPDRLRRELHLEGPDEAVLVLTRVEDQPIALLARRAVLQNRPTG